MSRHFKNQKEYEKDLCKIIQIIFFYEEKLEQIRISLAESARFNIVLLFFKISRMRNHITKNDLRSFFAINHQPVIEKECDYLIFNYSSNQGLSLTLEDFIQIFTPKTNKELIQRLQDQYQAYINGSLQIPLNEITQAEIPFFIEDISVKLLQLELRFFRELEAQKMYFTNKYGTNILTAFQNISNKGHGYDIIHKLFSRNGYTFTTENFNYLMNRIDKDGNGIITKDEFLDEKFILPSYRFASYSTMMSTQKMNFQGGNQQLDYRVTTPGTFRNQDNSDQKVQFSFQERTLLRGDSGNAQQQRVYSNNPQYRQNQGYNDQNILQLYSSNNNNIQQANQPHLIAQQEYVQQRIQNHQQYYNEQQLQQQQQYQPEQTISQSIEKQKQNPEQQSRQQNTQNIQFNDSLNHPINMHYASAQNSPNNFDTINDSLDHVNQVYVNTHSYSNIGGMSSKKIMN